METTYEVNIVWDLTGTRHWFGGFKPDFDFETHLRDPNSRIYQMSQKYLDLPSSLTMTLPRLKGNSQEIREIASAFNTTEHMIAQIYREEPEAVDRERIINRLTTRYSYPPHSITIKQR